MNVIDACKGAACNKEVRVIISIFYIDPPAPSHGRPANSPILPGPTLFRFVLYRLLSHYAVLTLYTPPSLTVTVSFNSFKRTRHFLFSF